MVMAKAQGITEKVFQSQIIQLAKTLGWRVYHPFLSKWSERGWPDLALANERQRRVLYAEIKREGGKLTDDQAEWLRLLSVCGEEAYYWFPSDWDTIVKILQGRQEVKK